MNWIDIILISILIYTLARGISLGLVLSIFNIVQIMLSVILTKRYYGHIYGYINTNSKLYNLFDKLAQFILKILFYSKSKGDIDFIPNLLSKGLVNIIIVLFSIIIVFFLSNKLLAIIMELFSFLLKTPILKQLNMIGGLIFGLLEGLFIIYLLNFVLGPILDIFPETLLGRGILGSKILNYIKEISLFKGGYL